MNILITGGANGLGEAITKQLSGSSKNKIFITYCNSRSKAKELEKKGNITAINCDFTQPDDIGQLTKAMDDMDLDILINNAMGPMTKKHAHKKEPHVYLQSFTNNVIPVITITQKAIEIFRKKRSGKIINILSSALEGDPPAGWSEYIANKAYLLSLSRSWALENASFNITSNCISPSFMRTDFHKDMDERFIEQIIWQQPLKKLLTVEETAKQIEELIGKTSANGMNFVIRSGSKLNAES